MAKNIPFVIERKVKYHGIWNIGLSFTDQLTKNITDQCNKKPACPAFITLSSSSFTLAAFSSSGNEVLHRDRIEFDALRDVEVNPYNQSCVIILFTNKKNTYSLLVCSCKDEQEAKSIASAYKRLKNMKIIEPQKNTNWILRKSTRSESFRSNNMSEVMNDNFAFLNSEDDFGDVFSDVEREIAEMDGDDPSSFHVGIQVSDDDISSTPSSLSSRGSTISLVSLRSELSVIENGHDPSPDSISQLEFYRSSAATSEDGGLIENGGLNQENGEKDENENSTEDIKKAKIKNEMEKVEEGDNYHWRSVSTMTEQLGGSRRYKKRPGSVSSSTNMYREMAAQRKQHTNGTEASPAPVSVPAPTPAPIPSPTSVFVVPRRRNSAPHQRHSLTIPRRPQSSRTSVIRPIEHVYSTVSRSNKRQRRRVFYNMPDGNIKGLPAK